MSTVALVGLQARLEQLGLDVPIPAFPEAQVLARPLDIYRSYLADILVNLLGCDPHVAYDSIQWVLELSSCDLTVVLPRLRISDSKPAELALELRKKFPKCSLFVPPIAEGIHLRLFFASTTLSRLLLPYIHDRKGSYGRDISEGLVDPTSGDGGRKKVVVEFSSPNIASGFTAAHLRSTITGAYVAAMYECMGWDVVRINYVGDWGKQIGLLAAGWARFGSEELFEADPFEHLLDVYAKAEEVLKPELEEIRKTRDEGKVTSLVESQGIFAERDAFFERLHNGDEEALGLWKRFRDVTIEHYKKLYARLNVTFDDFSGESQVNPEAIAEAEAILKEKGISTESDGSWIIDFTMHESRGLGTSILRYRSETTSYLLRDVAAIFQRHRAYSFDKMIYVVSANQDLHFQRIFKVLELIGRSDLADKLQHVNFGRVHGLLSEAGERPLDVFDKTTAAMAESVTAHKEIDVKFHIDYSKENLSVLAVQALATDELSIKRAHVYTFDTDRIVSPEAKNGRGLQYWYSRVCAELKDMPVCGVGTEEVDYSILNKDKYTDLLRLLAQYPEITKSSFRSLEPSTITSYLFRITEELSVILDEDDEQETALVRISQEHNAMAAETEKGETRVEVEQMKAEVKAEVKAKPPNETEPEAKEDVQVTNRALITETESKLEIVEEVLDTNDEHLQVRLKHLDVRVREKALDVRLRELQLNARTKEKELDVRLREKELDVRVKQMELEARLKEKKLDVMMREMELAVKEKEVGLMLRLKESGVQESEFAIRPDSKTLGDRLKEFEVGLRALEAKKEADCVEDAECPKIEHGRKDMTDGEEAEKGGEAVPDIEGKKHVAVAEKGGRVEQVAENEPVPEAEIDAGTMAIWALYGTVQQVLDNGMTALGLTPVVV